MKKYKVGILGATGMVGQRFITLLEQHPWFEVAVVAASPSSAEKSYEKAVDERWKMEENIPKKLRKRIVRSVHEDMKSIVKDVDFVFCALDLEKQKIREIEESYAELGAPVISNNSAHRWTDDIPMIIPEVNADHVKLIEVQRKKRKWTKGCIVVKPNCSIQSYVLILTALQKFHPEKVHITSLQAISGAGRTFLTWPEMVGNVIPFIGGEEEKSEKEPLKIWGKMDHNTLRLAKQPEISATCIRVAVSDGHMADVSVSFETKPQREKIFIAIEEFNKNNAATKLHLPSTPKQLIQYFEEENRPQTKLDRDFGHGMGISMGRLREDKHFDYSFIALSHNTIRGAAGGAILTAELLVKKGYID